MAFAPQPTRTPTAIADIEIRLFSPDPTGSETPGAIYAVQVRHNTGEIVMATGNLVPHLTQGQIDALLAFMDTMRAKAIDEILP